MHARTIGLWLLLLAAAWPALAGLTVQITSPRAKAVLYGSVQVVADVPADADMTHGVLFIDDVGVSAGNTQPLVFDVDTLGLTNGVHRLVAAAHNGYGAVAYSAPVTIIVMNPALDTGYLPRPSNAPRPTPVAAPAETPLPVPASPTTPASAKTAAPKTAKQPINWTSTPLTVTLDAQPLLFAMEPYTDRARTMVMIRALATSAGGTVVWDGSAAVVTWRTRIYRFTPNTAIALAGEDAVALDRPVAMRKGRIFVAVTTWRTCFGGRVVWQPEYQCVALESPAAPADTGSTPS